MRLEIHQRKSIDAKRPSGATSFRSEYDKPERKRGARLMLGESVVSAVVNGINGNFMGAFALKLGASTLQMGWFSAMAELFSACSQLMAPRVVGWMHGRKRMVITTALVSALPWGLIALTPVLPESFRVWAFMLVASLALSLLIMADPAWGSWISDLVHLSRRGRYMGLRGSMVTLVSVVIGMSGAVMLDRLEGAVMWGFAVAFVIALIARLVSAILYTQVVDPRPDIRLRPGVAPWHLFDHMGETKLGRYNLFILLFHFSMGFASPFFSVYLIRDIGVSYTTFVGLGVASNFAVVLTMPFWGRIADKKGNLFVLGIGAASVAFWPIMFIAVSQIWYLYMVHIIIGVLSAGWGLAVLNFVLENSDEADRPAAIGAFRAMASLGLFSGTIIAGVLATRVPTILTYQIATMFLISGAMRLISVAALLPRIAGKPAPAQVAEVKPVVLTRGRD